MVDPEFPRGRESNEMLMHVFAAEVGATVEEAVGLAVDRVQDVFLASMERRAERGDNGRRTVLMRGAAKPVRTASLRLPAAAGRVATTSSYAAMTLGMCTLFRTRLGLRRMRRRGGSIGRGM
jgi:hypothetical protein